MGSPQVAVVGIAAELPGGREWGNLDYSSFFQFLLEGGEAYETIPAERFNIHTLKGPGLGQTVTDTGAFIKNVDHFDYMEFGITNKDVRLMPLSTRKLIETTFLALLDSGIEYRGRNVGCYMAGVAHDIFSVSGHDDSEVRGSFAYAPAMVANRVSYYLDLRGPSLPVDTACSSTLTATHLAVQAIHNGECDAAVVGGSQINHRFSEWLLYSQGGVLSKDGKCKPFNASADGFGRGEGIVSIVLKKLDAAVRDNDKIYATILGTGINSCGSLAPVSAPVASSQTEAMKRAFAQAQRRPEEVDFLELHATGTAQGDPTEANWVGEHFKRDGMLPIGSVKGNVGHLEITAFLASLCKVCSILETGLIPPNVNVGRLNPAIKWDEYRLHVPQQIEKLKSRSASGRPLIAMTSSGIGGSNGHCVLEGPPSRASKGTSFWLTGDHVPAVLVAAGLTPRSTSAVSELIKDSVTSSDLLWTSRKYGRRARSLTWRSFAIHAHGTFSRFSEPSLVSKTLGPIVFVFSGQGPQHLHMGRELFHTNAVFRNSVLEMDTIFEKFTGYSLIKKHGLFDDLPPEESLGDAWPISVTLPSLAIVHMALFDTLVALGIKPDIVIGHSAGETAVIYTSGAGSKAMALELAVVRGRAMALIESAGGTMAALSCPPDEARDIIAAAITDAEVKVDVGCYNAPAAITISGDGEQIDAVVRRAQDLGIFARRLRTKVPVHSKMMELCQDKYREWVNDIFKRHATRIMATKVYSTKTGTLLDEHFTADYFWDSTRGPVKFTQAMQALARDHPNASYVEMGPHPVLSSYVTSMVGSSSVVVCPLRRAKPTEPPTELRGLLEAVGKLIIAGYNCVDFDTLCGVPATELYQVTYPFAKREVPYLAPTLEVARQRQHRKGPLNYPQLRINAQTHPGLAEHVIKDEPIMPAAGFMEMALEFGARELWDVEFTSILTLSSERPTPTLVDLQEGKWTVSSVPPADADKTWPPKYSRLHAHGYLSTSHDFGDDPNPIVLTDVLRRLKPVNMKDLYSSFTSFAQFGPSYRRVVECFMGLDDEHGQEFLVRLRGRDSDLPDIDDYFLHPAILDSSLHISVHPFMTGYRQGSRYYLPAKVGHLKLYNAAFQRPFPETLYAYARYTKWTPDALYCNFTVQDDVGDVLYTMEDLQLALHGNNTPKPARRYELVTEALESPMDPSAQSESKIPTILQYTRGGELEIQRLILTLDPLEPCTLWFTASAGLDGDAALGFTRSLRREYPVWNVRVAVFDQGYISTERSKFIGSLSMTNGDEGEIYVDANGHITVPRIAVSEPPRTCIDFDPSKPWSFDGHRFSQMLNSNVPQGHVCVNVDLISKPLGGLWTFIGHLDDSSDRVAGISAGPVSNSVVTHNGSLCTVPGTNSAYADILAYAIAVHATGIRSFEVPARLHGRSVLVTHSDEGLVRSLATIFKSRGVTLFDLPSNPTIQDLRARCSTKYDLIIIGPGATSYEREMLRDALYPHGKIFLWADEQSGLHSLLRGDPWAIGDALQHATWDGETRATLSPPLEVIDAPPPPEVDFSAAPFDANKSYLLVGGIGSLGMEIALWMYHRGARSIVLTSRSGRSSVASKGSILAKRILSYLETVADLDLRLVAVDATSVDQMRTLVDNLAKPLGGCMLLSVVLADRTFASQTRDTFEAPFLPKTEAFRVMEQTLPMSNLDFIITFSSVSGMFGNAGQTNYASANTALAGMTKAHKNAFCLVVPGIIDSSIALNDEFVAAKLTHLSNWGMTAAELCEYIEDGIRKLSDGPVWQYIPDFDWNLVFANMGSSTMYNHLVTQTQDSADGDAVASSESVRDIVCRILDVPADDLSAEVPLTSYGLDSLSAANLSYTLAPFLKISQIQLLADMTVKQLEERIEASREAEAPAEKKTEPQGDKPASRPHVDERAAKIHEMIAMVNRFSQFDDAAKAPRPSADQHEKVVLLTGTTGSLGSHVLQLLLRDPSVQKVYALYRRKDGQPGVRERQQVAFDLRALAVNPVDLEKLVTLEADAGSEKLALEDQVYDEMYSSLTHIVHMGWTISFNRPLSAYEADIRALRALIDLALGPGARPAAKFVFAGSAGMFRNLESLPSLPVSESTPIEAEVTVGSGYSESKWVSERVLAAAGEQTSLRPTTVRLHQLTGSRNGVWKTSEWFPSIVAASSVMGCVPNSNDMCAWLPVDIAASVMVDVMSSNEPIVHLRHPKPVPLLLVTKTISRTLRLQLVPYAEWVKRLEAESGRVARGECKPSSQLQSGLRLLDIFRTGVDHPAGSMMDSFGLMCKLDIARALESSETLRSPDLPELSEVEVMRWTEHWRDIGFLEDHERE